MGDDEMNKKGSKAWNHGDMMFENKSCKPKGMSMETWLKVDGGRCWISKDDEMPSMFLARIVRGMEASGANILPHLLEELEKLKTGAK
jgi:hypothetical protein